MCHTHKQDCEDISYHHTQENRMTRVLTITQRAKGTNPEGTINKLQKLYK